MDSSSFGDGFLKGEKAVTKRVIQYRLTLEAPLVLTVPGGDPNSAETLPFISGSSILGVLAGRWLHKNSCPKNAAHDERFRNLFLSDKVCYVHAYPEETKGDRLLPAPLSLYREKGEEDVLYDLARPDAKEIIEDQNGKRLDLRPWQGGFIRFKDHFLYYRSLQRRAQIHHQRDRDMGRATEEKGAIFSYVSLDRGERFIGMILCEDIVYGKTIEDLLRQGPLLLGRSKSAQYGGKARVEILTDPDGEKFAEAGSQKADSGRWVVTLLSDYLGVNALGHYTADPQTWLNDFSEKLGMTQGDVDFYNDDPEGKAQNFAQVRPVSGYVSAWRMPRPVRPALKAGSVFVLDVKKKVDEKRLASLLWKGLGDRCNEGFGRLAVNWHGQENEDHPTYTLKESSLVELHPLSSSSPDHPDADSVLQLCRKRLLKNNLDEKLVGACERLSLSALPPGKLPNKALTGRLRGLIARAQTPNDISDFLNTCQNRNKPAGEQLRRCRIGNRNLSEWLQQLFQDNQFIKAHLNLDILAEQFTLAEKQVVHSLFESMAWSYQKRLADRVLKELARLKTEAEKKEKSHG